MGFYLYAKVDATSNYLELLYEHLLELCSL